MPNVVMGVRLNYALDCWSIAIVVRYRGWLFTVMLRLRNPPEFLLTITS